TVGIVKLYGEHRDAPEHFFDDSRQEAERRHKLLEPHAVTSLPSKPKANELYVLDLTPVREGKLGTSPVYEFDFRPWMGAEGWAIQTSNGKTIEVLPHQYE